MSLETSRAGEFDNHVLPKLHKVEFNGWSIIGERNLIQFLLLDEKIASEFEATINELILTSDQNNTRRVVDFNTVNLTSCIFYDAKIIRLYTLHLGNELFFIHELERISHSLTQCQDYLDFLFHVEAGAGMDINRFPSVMAETQAKYDLVDLEKIESEPSIKSSLNITTSKLLDKVNEYKPGLFEKVSDYALRLNCRIRLNKNSSP